MTRFNESLTFLTRTVHAVGCIVSVLLLLLGWAAGHSLHRHTASARLRQEEAELRLTKAPEIHNNQQRLAATLATAKGETDSLNSQLTSGPEEVQLITQLAELGRKIQLKIKSFRPGAKKEHGQLGEFELRLSCEGSYAALRSFLAELDRTGRLGHISSLDVSPLDESGREVIAEIQLHFFYKQILPPAVSKQEGNHAA